MRVASVCNRMADLQALDLDGNGVLDRNEIAAAFRQRNMNAEDAEVEASLLAGEGGIRLEAGTEALDELRDKLKKLDHMKRNLDNMERTQQERKSKALAGGAQEGPPSRSTEMPRLPEGGDNNAVTSRSKAKKGKRNGPVMNKRMIALLARLVDERMNAEFSQRDKILVEMRDSMEIMRGELEQNILVAQQAAALVQNSPVRPSGRPRFGKGSPLTDQRLVQPGVTRSSLSQPLQRTGAVPSPLKTSRRRVPSDSTGRVLLSAKNMPRVAMLVPDDEETRKALRLQALAADAEYRRSMVRYKHCRSTVFMPSGYIPQTEIGDEKLPSTSLDLEFIHGYSGKLPFRTTMDTNAYTLATGEIVYPASATVVIYDKVMHRQRFFFGHDDDVTCVAVHPNGSIVASGQVGRRPPVCVWDTAMVSGHPKQSKGNTGYGNMTSADVTHLGNLMFHSRGISCMAFSTDGALLVSIGTDDAHHAAVWDWTNGVLLAQARAYNTDVYKVAFSPVSFVGIGTVSDLDDVTYTLITCGKRHIKFWSLHREFPDERKKSRMEKDSLDIVKRDRRERLKRKGGISANTTSKEWVLVGNTGSFGRAAKLQDMRTFCFMPSGHVIAGTEKGHLYVWEQSRDMAQEVRYTDDGREFLPVRWDPQGKLVVSVVLCH